MRKTTQSNEIPVTILKQNGVIFSDYICNLFNFCVNEGKFPNILKQANIIPAFKKGYRRYDESYRPLREYLKNFLVNK